jgi:hypothetical protein
MATHEQPTSKSKISKIYYFLKKIPQFKLFTDIYYCHPLLKRSIAANGLGGKG